MAFRDFKDFKGTEKGPITRGIAIGATPTISAKIGPRLSASNPSVENLKVPRIAASRCRVLLCKTKRNNLKPR